MESNIYTNETNNIELSNQTLSSIKSITFIKINTILGGTRLNSHILGQLFQTIQMDSEIRNRGGGHESAHSTRRPRLGLEKLMQLPLCDVKTCMDY
jgi:hypothetical protein